ncbi:MAG: amidase [Chloroflexi bacterium]|nr:amidase [Chloroflexota bacterium]
MPNELAYTPATEIASRIRRRDLSPVEAVDYFFDRIEKLNSPLNAFIIFWHEDARKRAKKAEQDVMNGKELGPLHGVPMAIKDLFDFRKGFINTFGAKPFANFVAPVSAAYVERFEEAGAIILGKTNSPEFGHKGVTDNLLFGPTSTPFKIGKNAGGSSGGSASAVAAGLIPFAQGSDGGGSIRIPSAWCGTYGFKASFGRVPNVMRPNAFGSHTPYVHAGPITRNVEDAALMLSVMTGNHERDPFSIPDDPADYMAATKRSMKGMRIAYSPDWDIWPVDSEVAKIVAKAVQGFKDAGAKVEEVKLGITHDQYELAQIWRRQGGALYAPMVLGFKEQGIDLMGKHKKDIPPDMLNFIELGLKGTALQQAADSAIRSEIFDAVQNVFEKYDFLVTPTLAAMPVDNATNGITLGPATINGVKMDRCIGWCMTFLINFTGHPAASIPAGLSKDGLPVGMQIIGRRYDDAGVLAASAAFERVRPWMHTYVNLEKSILAASKPKSAKAKPKAKK